MSREPKIPSSQATKIPIPEISFLSEYRYFSFLLFSDSADIFLRDLNFAFLQQVSHGTFELVLAHAGLMGNDLRCCLIVKR